MLHPMVKHFECQNTDFSKYQNTQEGIRKNKTFSFTTLISLTKPSNNLKSTVRYQMQEYFNSWDDAKKEIAILFAAKDTWIFNVKNGCSIVKMDFPRQH